MAPRSRKPAGPRKSDPAVVLVLHGPNLNLLGTRDPQIYGRETLSEVDARLLREAAARGVGLIAFQSNHEGALIDRIHLARDEGVRFIVINPSGLGTTSVALRDALVGTAIPFIEVHLSNTPAREPFRHRSLLADEAVGSIVGLGTRGYDFALAYALATF